jgi:hypothetical protein
LFVAGQIIKSPSIYVRIVTAKDIYIISPNVRFVKIPRTNSRTIAIIANFIEIAEKCFILTPLIELSSAAFAYCFSQIVQAAEPFHLILLYFGLNWLIQNYLY